MHIIHTIPSTEWWYSFKTSRNIIYKYCKCFLTEWRIRKKKPPPKVLSLNTFFDGPKSISLYVMRRVYVCLAPLMHLFLLEFHTNTRVTHIHKHTHRIFTILTGLHCCLCYTPCIKHSKVVLSFITLFYLYLKCSLG